MSFKYATGVNPGDDCRVTIQFRAVFNKFDENGESSTDNLRVTEFTLKNLQKQAWLGKLNAPALRGLSWRVFWGFLGPQTLVEWAMVLREQTLLYADLKAKTLPSVLASPVDPLSSFSKVGQQSEEWRRFEEQVELASLITIDIDRLYMSGVDDDYFQRPEVKERIHAVLFIWSLRNEKVSYRQGMHEIVGTIYHVLEVEKRAWDAQRSDQSPSPFLFQHPLLDSFTDATLEAHCYFLFERIMKDLVPLYDPNPLSQSPEGLPVIVDFCSRIQEHFLRQIDPELSDHLEECYVQAQLYGLRWARLLLGREFPLTNHQSLRLWDYMFSYCMDSAAAANALSGWRRDYTTTSNTSNNSKDKEVDQTAAELAIANGNVSVSAATAVMRARDPYAFTPLMGILGDFFLAMLLHIRQSLMEGDSNEVLGLLMKYPKLEDVTPVMDLADMLRRGVLYPNAHIAHNNANSTAKADPLANAGIPSWLKTSVAAHVSGPVATSSQLASSMSRKVSEVVRSAVLRAQESGSFRQSQAQSRNGNISNGNGTSTDEVAGAAYRPSSELFDPLDPLSVDPAVHAPGGRLSTTWSGDGRPSYSFAYDSEQPASRMAVVGMSHSTNNGNGNSSSLAKQPPPSNRLKTSFDAFDAFPKIASNSSRSAFVPSYAHVNVNGHGSASGAHTSANTGSVRSVSVLADSSDSLNETVPYSNSNVNKTSDPPSPPRIVSRVAQNSNTYANVAVDPLSGGEARVVPVPVLSSRAPVTAMGSSRAQSQSQSMTRQSPSTLPLPLQNSSDVDSAVLAGHRSASASTSASFKTYANINTSTSNNNLSDLDKTPPRNNSSSNSNSRPHSRQDSYSYSYSNPNSNPNSDIEKTPPRNGHGSGKQQLVRQDSNSAKQPKPSKVRETASQGSPGETAPVSATASTSQSQSIYTLYNSGSNSNSYNSKIQSVNNNNQNDSQSNHMHAISEGYSQTQRRGQSATVAVAVAVADIPLQNASSFHKNDVTTATVSGGPGNAHAYPSSGANSSGSSASSSARSSPAPLVSVSSATALTMPTTKVTTVVGSERFRDSASPNLIVSGVSAIHNGVADRLAELADLLRESSVAIGGESPSPNVGANGPSTVRAMAAEQASKLGDVLRGTMSLGEYDRRYRSCASL